MQRIASLEHAQRVLRQRELHDAQVQQLIEYLLGQVIAVRDRSQAFEALLLAMLEFTRTVMTHVEKTGHQDDPELKAAFERAVETLQRAQGIIKPTATA
jgi:hypothetical protein